MSQVRRTTAREGVERRRDCRRLRGEGGFAADAGRYDIFVAILVRAGRPGLTAAGGPGVPVNADTVFLKASGNWQAYTGGALSAYLSNVEAPQVDAVAVNVLANTDISGISGTQFWVGYGTSAEEMIASWRLRLMYEVP